MCIRDSHIAASTWVVCANTQFATVSFFPCLFFFFCWFSSARTQLAPVDRSAPKLACKCGFGQGCAFWGLDDDQSRLGVLTPKKQNFWGVNRHFKPNLQKSPMNRLRWWSYMMTWQIQDGGRPPSWISIFGHNFGVDQHFCTKFVTAMENRQPNGSQCSEFGLSKIQDGGRPPFWISIFGHNFGVDQHFCAKFGTVIENRKPNGSQC